jgi:hypothetical protein
MFKILKVNFQNLKTENTSVNAPDLIVKTNFEPGVTAGLVPWFPGSRTLLFQGEKMHWNTFPVKCTLTLNASSWCRHH